MHWLVLAAAALAIGYYQVGAMSVWISVLSITLKVVLMGAAMVAVGVVLNFLWRRFR